MMYHGVVLVVHKVSTCVTNATRMYLREIHTTHGPTLQSACAGHIQTVPEKNYLLSKADNASYHFSNQVISQDASQSMQLNIVTFRHNIVRRIHNQPQ